MKTIQLITAALLLLTPEMARSDDPQAGRAKAREETVEALETYKQVLKNELRQLESWAGTLDGPGGKSLEDERELAKKKLEEMAEEAKRAWENSRARMDAVVDDLKRDAHEARARR